MSQILKSTGLSTNLLTLLNYTFMALIILIVCISICLYIFKFASHETIRFRMTRTSITMFMFASQYPVPIYQWLIVYFNTHDLREAMQMWKKCYNIQGVCLFLVLLITLLYLGAIYFSYTSPDFFQTLFYPSPSVFECWEADLLDYID